MVDIRLLVMPGRSPVETSSQKQASGCLEAAGDLGVGRVPPHAGSHQRSCVELLERLDHIGIRITLCPPKCCAEPLVYLTADPEPQMLDIGILAEQSGGDRARQFRLVGNQQCDMPKHADHAVDRVRGDSSGGAGVDARRRQNTSATRCSFDEKYV